MLKHRSFPLIAGITAAAVLVACGGEKSSGTQAPPTATSAAEAAAAGSQTPDPGGKVVTVELSSDGAGNYFKPSEVHVRRGDVVRYTLKVGVHNVHFVPDSNGGKTGYPPAGSDLLQLPGQTYDLVVHMAKGSYYFQCDPHAALGMKGHLVVE